MRFQSFGLLGLIALACNREPAASLVETTDVAPGEACANGGTRVDVGADDGDPDGTAGDGVLQSGEIDASAIACNGTAAHAVLSTSTPIEPGATCELGGARVDWGTDDGDPSGVPDDGVLQQGEIEGSEDLCVESAGMLVVVVPLEVGDATCPRGGQQISYGYDDGEPGGTAGDGILDPAEVDATQDDCVTVPEDVFTLFPATTPGSERIDAAGGTSSSESGGMGGEFEVLAYGGPLPVSIEVRRDGDLGLAIPTPAPTADLGANGVVVSSSVTVPLFEGGGAAPSTLHLRLTGGSTAERQLGELYVGDAIVTGLRVAPGVTVTFDQTTYSGAGIELAADFDNQGTVAVTPTGGSGSLWVRCDDFVNTGTIDLRGSPSSGEVLVVADEIWQMGTLRLDGADAGAPGQGGDAVLVAAHGLYEGGTISTTGGTASAAVAGRNGGNVRLATASGLLQVAGGIDTSGGDGTTGGNAGAISALVGLTAAQAYNYDVHDLAPPGAGSYVQTGSFVADGGSSSATAAGRNGGHVTIDVRGGEVRVGGSVQSLGGDAATGRGGRGGELTVIAAPRWAEPMALPTFVGVQSTVDLSAGASTANDGGDGGLYSVIVDVTQGTVDDETLYPTDSAPLPAGALTGAPVRVAILGLGEGIHLDGGEIPGIGDRGGRGGRFDVHTNPCIDEDDSCNVTAVGPRWIHGDVDVSVAGGNGDEAQAGSGGTIDFTVTTRDANLEADADGALVESLGLLDISSGQSGVLGSWQGGQVTLTNDAGDLLLDGSVVGEGGGATVDVAAYAVRQEATIDLDGGPTFHDAGRVLVAATSFLSAGAIEARGGSVDDGADGGDGGTVTIAADGPVDLSGAIDLSGGAAGDGWTAGGGGQLIATGDTVTVNAGVVLSSGVSEADCFPGYAGAAWLTGPSAVTVAGDIDVGGGGCTDLGGDGGDVVVVGPASVTGSLRVAGRDGEASGGWGGQITVNGDVSGAIDASGGDALDAVDSAASGGRGGVVEISGDNSASIACHGGSAHHSASGEENGGHGGTVLIGGDNSGCLDVDGGPPDGVAGTIVVSGADTGTCP